jgi:hypothetical protein
MCTFVHLHGKGQTWIWQDRVLASYKLSTRSGYSAVLGVKAVQYVTLHALSNRQVLHDFGAFLLPCCCCQVISWEPYLPLLRQVNPIVVQSMVIGVA